MKISTRTISRALKLIARKFGWVFLRNPNSILPRSRPFGFSIRRFAAARITVLGPLGVIGKRVFPITNNGIEEGGENFAVSSFLVRNLPEEKWVVKEASGDRHFPTAAALLGKGERGFMDLTPLKGWNYFHFLLRVIPAWIDLGEDSVGCIQPGKPTTWQQSIADFLGLRIEEQGVTGSFDKQVEIEAGMYPTTRGVGMFRDLFSDRLEKINGSVFPGRKISGEPHVLWLTRSPRTVKHSERFVTNERELVDRIRGFAEVTVVDMGSLPFEEQVRLVNKSALLVGAHGAALTNIALHKSPETLAMVEIFPSGNKKWHYEKLSRLVGARYQGVEAKSQGTKDLRIDVEELVSSVRKMLFA